MANFLVLDDLFRKELAKLRTRHDVRQKEITKLERDYQKCQLQTIMEVPVPSLVMTSRSKPIVYFPGIQPLNICQVGNNQDGVEQPSVVYVQLPASETN